MTFTRHRVLLLTLVVGALLAPGAGAAVVPINLKTAFFTLDDPDVMVAADGTSATFTESGVATFLRLTNDPFLGDANVIVALAGRSLRFGFDFDEAADGTDSFSAFLFDSDLGIIAGTLASFAVTERTLNGTHSFDLTPWVGRNLGLEFELAELDSFGGTLGSTASVRNLALTTVPLPGAAWGLLAGLGVLAGGSRSRLRRKQAIGSPVDQSP